MISGAWETKFRFLQNRTKTTTTQCDTPIISLTSKAHKICEGCILEWLFVEVADPIISQIDWIVAVEVYRCWVGVLDEITEAERRMGLPAVVGARYF